MKNNKQTKSGTNNAKISQPNHEDKPRQKYDLLNSAPPPIDLWEGIHTPQPEKEEIKTEVAPVAAPVIAPQSNRKILRFPTSLRNIKSNIKLFGSFGGPIPSQSKQEEKQVIMNPEPKIQAEAHIIVTEEPKEKHVLPPEEVSKDGDPSAIPHVLPRTFYPQYQNYNYYPQMPFVNHT